MNMGDKKKHDKHARFQKALEEVYDLLNPDGERFKAFLARTSPSTSEPTGAEPDESESEQE